MDNIKKPKVSIIIPVYNGSNYLGQAIDSALAQTYKNIEIIVVNDGSKDDGATERVALSYKDKIHYYTKPNGGVSSALNYGIEKMSGEYFSWLSHDDLYEPRKIEATVNLLDKGIKNKTIAFCGSRLIDKEGNSILSVKRKFKSFYTGIEIFRECFKNQKGINGCTLLIPKEALKRAGGFSDLIYLQDMECWAKLMMLGYSFAYTPEILVMMRMHKQQVTKLKPEKYYEEFPIYIDRLYQFAIQNANNEKAFLYYILIIYWQKGIQASNLEAKINKHVNPPFFLKGYYKSKGLLLHVFRNIIHKLRTI